DLLAVDDPLVAVFHRGGAQRRKVGAGTRLRVADGKVALPRQDPREESALLLVRAELHDRLADRVDREERQREARPPRFVREDELLDLPAGLTAVLLRPADPEPAVAAQLADRLQAGRAAAVAPRHLGAPLGGHQRGEVLAQLAAQRLLFGRVRDPHSSGPLPRTETCFSFLAPRRGPRKVTPSTSSNRRLTRRGSHAAERQLDGS